MLFCCDCFFTVTFVPSKSIQHYSLGSRMIPVLIGKCLGTRWFMGGCSMDRGPSRVLGLSPPLQNHLRGIQLSRYYASSKFSGVDRSLCAFCIFWMNRMEQPQLSCVSVPWSRQALSESCLPATHLWLRHLQRELQQVTATLFASLCPAWKMRTVLHNLCWSFPSIPLHTLYLILVLAATFILLCTSVFEPGLGVRLKPSQPHTWFLKWGWFGAVQLVNLIDEPGLRPALPEQSCCADWPGCPGLGSPNSLKLLGCSHHPLPLVCQGTPFHLLHEQVSLKSGGNFKLLTNKCWTLLIRS